MSSELLIEEFEDVIILPSIDIRVDKTVSILRSLSGDGSASAVTNRRQ